ncbi:hypothetical protein FM755_08825 [Francisella tularensis]|uniref:Uncharacterized protein n=3 Tax=Francisella tularensis TaxID=263 RepID=A0AAI8FU96_FRATH|nr:hypothetical protein [Francisella tularensis]ABO46545.1 hypothetical protein FTW_0644 [Francisella tularensis subsp. tularensis WY96-3418]ABU61936.1 hypothetical protein FTA_1461 [Francisella tularensis subsp. holarctica FTNF002-00]ADA78419.1 hypothetical protein NE061598_04220 [Francisella tularensis subsp. tularensis NE061598]AFB78854.1 hypothetical protein FTU_0778 [Francisella tularensis subsp. tularensis TIGB03]AFB80398.1 hypothetical protein FTV_0693 [Francisella tularensis subsp. tul
MLIIKVAAIVNFFILLPFGFLPLSLCEYYYIGFYICKTNDFYNVYQLNLYKDGFIADLY